MFYFIILYYIILYYRCEALRGISNTVGAIDDRRLSIALSLSLCMCILHIYIYIYNIHTCTYVYMYMCRYVCLYIHICIYVCVCICIYIYIYREREREIIGRSRRGTRRKELGCACQVPATWKHGWSRHGSSIIPSSHSIPQDLCSPYLNLTIHARTMFTPTMFSRGRKWPTDSTSRPGALQ